MTMLEKIRKTLRTSAKQHAGLITDNIFDHKEEVYAPKLTEIFTEAHLALGLEQPTLDETGLKRS